MRFQVLFFACSFAWVSLSNAASVPFIKKCKADDSKCLKQSTQDAIPVFAKGISELGLESLSPLYIKTLDASSPSLKLKTKDLKFTHLENCVPKKVQRDKATSKLFVEIQCTTNLDGYYEMKGQLLILPIEGKGKVHAVIRKMVVTIDGELGEEVKNGEKYWTVKSWNSSFELKDRSELEFENLFNGNEVLASAAREIIRNSANEIILEIGSPIVNGVIKKVVENIKHFFSNVPIKDLSLD